MKQGLLAIVSSELTGAANKDDVTFYGIKVNTYDLKTESAEEWEVERRYSQFEKLHKKLGHMGWALPPMPPSRIFGARNFDTVEERKVAFAAILEALVKVTCIE